MTAPYLLVGESPNPVTAKHPDLWLLPSSAVGGMRNAVNRLLHFAGWDLKRYLDTFERTNLLDYCPSRCEPGPWARGRTFKLREAQERASLIVRQVRDGEFFGMLVLGRRAAEAFAWDAPSLRRLPYLEWRRAWGGVYGPVRAAVIPHPSGVNRWWHRVENQERARRFLRALRRNR